MRVAVIGLGGTGVAAARFLARAGHEVTGFEQFRIGHGRASSHGESRIIRYTYADPLYTRLMGEAYPLWTELEEEAREPLVVRCGGIFLGPQGHPELLAMEQSLREAGRPYEALSAHEVRARFPALRLQREEAAIFQADSGFLRATACVLAGARLARAHGSTLLEEAPVLEVRSAGGRVTVHARAGDGAASRAGSAEAASPRTDAGGGAPSSMVSPEGASSRTDAGRAVSPSSWAGEARGTGQARSGAKSVDLSGAFEVEFDAAIVTAGPWVGKLLAGAGLPLRVTRQELVYLRIGRNAPDFEPDRLPVWIDAATYDYGFPSDGRVQGVKMGLHRLGETVDQDCVDLTVHENFVRARALYAASRLPDLAPIATHTQVCLYTNAPDEDFIVDRAPGLPGVWLVSGCSGHGFKFTALLGKIAAELVTGEGPPRDLSRFSLARFGGSPRR